MLKDKIVLVGASAAGLLDIRSTPFAAAVPGVQIHATAVDNILQGDALRYDTVAEVGMTGIFVLVAGTIMAALVAYLPPILNVAAACLLIVSTVWGNYQFLFLRNQSIGLSYPLLALSVVLIVVSAFKQRHSVQRQTEPEK